MKTLVKSSALSSDKIKPFMVAGKASFTVVNEVSGNRFTFKMSKPKKDKANPNAPIFVSVLTGQSNETDYSYFGTIHPKHNEQFVFNTKKSRITQDAQSVKVFEWLWTKVLTGTIPTSVKVFHEGKCGCCGRKLTVPSSIESGLGPFCATK